MAGKGQKKSQKVVVTKKGGFGDKMGLKSGKLRKKPP
jgi:hypothetical protein